jgi:hypothetical protein
MNWEAIGAVGELLSAAGVVFTLGYLAVQIRQSNNIASWETHRSAVTGYSEAMQSVLHDAGAARVYRCGLLDLESLGPDDRLRFSTILSVLSLNFKDTLAAYDANMFDEPTYDAWRDWICCILNTPGGAIWWQENQSTYIPRVREVIDKGRLEVPAMNVVSPTFFVSDTQRTNTGQG